ncbi:hypothetical protein MHC_04895 [Mycoplasma haemocanis str. Illinois]|uniref:Uncharacterized protein n=1 Tax=Mycoplasma haemocanis (strain Illinois) TaxID=1111676 RepID=H6N863_MYCHN|nr:hypothetical protein [Mycoplasma haemocanis]AEW45835.1 hypothetical protein MHC_04895 [Mycoplasma haemocanis str. Illinois]
MSFLKVAAGLGAVSGTAGLGYLSFHYSSSNSKKVTISELFKKEGRTFLSKGADVEQWKERWNSYVTENKDSWKLEDYSSQKSDVSKAPDSFVNKCLLNADVKVTGISDSLYLEVVKNCSKEFKVEDLVTSEGKRTKLNSASGDDAEWKSSWQDYIRNSPDNKWNIENWASAKLTPDTVPQDFKTKCTSKLAEKAFGIKDIKFENVIAWCTKNKVT